MLLTATKSLKTILNDFIGSLLFKEFVLFSRGIDCRQKTRTGNLGDLAAIISYPSIQ